MRLLISWVINALALLALPYIFESIRVEGFYTALITALVLGLVNALIRPLLILLTLPINILTLGLFTFVINALLLYFVGQLIPGFHVDTFWSAFWGALIISVVALVLNSLTGTGGSRIQFRRHRRPPDSGSGGSGPVIDV